MPAIFFVGKPEGREALGRRNVDGKAILQLLSFIMTRVYVHRLNSRHRFLIGKVTAMQFFKNYPFVSAI